MPRSHVNSREVHQVGPARVAAALLVYIPIRAPPGLFPPRQQVFGVKAGRKLVAGSDGAVEGFRVGEVLLFCTAMGGPL